MSGRVVRSSQHTKKTGSSGSSESSSQSDFSMGQRIPDRIQFIRNFPANRRFAQLAMEAGDESHIVHHEHDDDDSEDRCTDVKCILQKKTKNFDAIICQIGGTLEYIKSGTTGHTLKGSVVEENLNYAMKVVAYPKKDHYPDPNNIERPENAELLMIRLLSKLVVDIKTPHIILPIGTFDIDLSQFIASTRNKIIDCDRYDAFIERFQKNEFYPKASVLLSEWADRGDLLDYIRSNYHTMTEMDWRVIFFQILQCLAAIHEEYPDFRHNDAKANNWLCRGTSVKRGTTFHSYKNMGNCYYVVPNIGIQLGLWDFDFACIPGHVNNTKVTSKGTDQINIKPECHQYYDIHFFFNTLGSKAFFPKLYTSSKIPKSVTDFVNRVIPPRYRSSPRYVTTGGRIKTNEVIWTPIQLLETDPFFKDFRFSSRQDFIKRKVQVCSDRRKTLSSDEPTTINETDGYSDDNLIPDRQA